MNKFYDQLETRSSEQRNNDYLTKLPEIISYAQKNSPYYQKSLNEIDATAINSITKLASLPILRKHQLINLQKEFPPFGGIVSKATGQLARVFASPGPIFEPEGKQDDYWRSARALFAAGVREGDLIHNSFSYHMTPGAWILDAGARALGCAIFPAGVGQTEQQIEAINILQPNTYVGTPSFLRILLEKSLELNQPITSFKKALVSGEAFLPVHREIFTSSGIDTYQAYATADLGVIAYETSAHHGLVIDENIIVEIVRPGSNIPLEIGEVGEVVVTNFNQDYPLIRFATGDLSMISSASSACGRTQQCLKGWMGRADQTAKVKGMFVHPEQIVSLLEKFTELSKVRLVISNPNAIDHLVLQCVTKKEIIVNDNLIIKLKEAFREVSKLRGEIEFVESIINDGKIIDDTRKVE